MQTQAMLSFLRRRLHDFEDLTRIKILRMPSFESLVNKIESLKDQLTRYRALNEALQSNNEALQSKTEALQSKTEALHSRVRDFSSDRQVLQEEIRRVRQSRDHLHARVEQARVQLLAITDNVAQLPSSLKAHAFIDPADPRFPPAHSFVRLPEIPEEVYCIDIVDVGAEPLEFEEDIYEPLTGEGNCRVIGFDPFEAESGAGGNPTDSDSRCQRIVLPYFIGSGGPAQFHVNRFRPTSSLFPSNMELLEHFPALAEMCSTERIIEVETKRLDDIQEIQACDFLKVDVQGGDYDVVAHGTRVLESTLFVHIETEFSCIYSDQPLFPETDRLLRSQGFEFIDYVKFGWNRYRALSTPYVGSRLLWADSIYMKEPRRIAERGPLLLLRAAFIAHVNYRKYDLAAHLLHLYDEQCGSSLKDSYAASFFA